MNSLRHLRATTRDTTIMGMNEVINHEMKLIVELRPMIFIVYSHTMMDSSTTTAAIVFTCSTFLSRSRMRFFIETPSVAKLQNKTSEILHLVRNPTCPHQCAQNWQNEIVHVRWFFTPTIVTWAWSFTFVSGLILTGLRDSTGTASSACTRLDWSMFDPCLRNANRSRHVRWDLAIGWILAGSAFPGNSRFLVQERTTSCSTVQSFGHCRHPSESLHVCAAEGSSHSDWNCSDWERRYLRASIHRFVSNLTSVRISYQRWPFDSDGVLLLARRVLLRIVVLRNDWVQYTADNHWTVSEQRRHCSELRHPFRPRSDSWASKRSSQYRTNPCPRCCWTAIERNGSRELSSKATRRVRNRSVSWVDYFDIASVL